METKILPNPVEMKNFTRSGGDEIIVDNLRSDKLWGPAQHLDGCPGFELLGRPKVDDLHRCVVLLGAHHVLRLKECF